MMSESARAELAIFSAGPSSNQSAICALSVLILGLTRSASKNLTSNSGEEKGRGEMTRAIGLGSKWKASFYRSRLLPKQDDSFFAAGSIFMAFVFLLFLYSNQTIRFCSGFLTFILLLSYSTAARSAFSISLFTIDKKQF